MGEIEKKLFELIELLENVPLECKGDSPIARANRRRYMKIKEAVYGL